MISVPGSMGGSVTFWSNGRYVLLDENRAIPLYVVNNQFGFYNMLNENMYEMNNKWPKRIW